MCEEAHPTVSVIVPTHNRAGLLARAVGTVLDQIFTDFEPVAMNGGSVDGTVDRMAKFTDPRVRVINIEPGR